MTKKIPRRWRTTRRAQLPPPKFSPTYQEEKNTYLVDEDNGHSHRSQQAWRDWAAYNDNN